MEYVAGLMFSSDYSRLAMIVKNRPKWQEGLFNVIGGKIEADEVAENAMAREFLEETGVETHPNEWSYMTRLYGSWGTVWFFTMYDDRVLKVQTMEDELVQLVNPRMLPHNIIGNLRWIIPLALDPQVAIPKSFHYDTGESK